MEQSLGKALENFAKSISVTAPVDKPSVAQRPAPPKPAAVKLGGSYLLTSTQFTGAVVFQFDADGFLERYDMSEAKLTDVQKAWILQKMPKSIEALKSVLGSSKDAKLIEQKASAVTFEQFWDRYNAKANSSKKKSQSCWNRMSQVQRDRAFNFIETYFKSIPPGIAKKYAETYLNAEQWNN